MCQNSCHQVDLKGCTLKGSWIKGSRIKVSRLSFSLDSWDGFLYPGRYEICLGRFDRHDCTQTNWDTMNKLCTHTAYHKGTLCPGDTMPRMPLCPKTICFIDTMPRWMTCPGGHSFRLGSPVGIHFIWSHTPV